MALSKTAINKEYDKLKSQLKSGDLSQKQFKIAADRLYKLYHSDANKAQRAKDAKPAAKKTTKATSSSQKPETPTKTKPTAAKPTTPSNTRRQRQPGSTGGRGKAPSGTYGKSLPSNPKLKSQPKTKTKSKLRRGSGLGGRKKPTMFNLTAMLRELGGVDPKTGRKKK
jgi:hypothetical protein